VLQARVVCLDACTRFHVYESEGACMSSSTGMCVHAHVLARIGVHAHVLAHIARVLVVVRRAWVQLCMHAHVHTRS
jgi:hypothetical protein